MSRARSVLQAPSLTAASWRSVSLVSAEGPWDFSASAQLLGRAGGRLCIEQRNWLAVYTWLVVRVVKSNQQLLPQEPSVLLVTSLPLALHTHTDRRLWLHKPRGCHQPERLQTD